MKTFKQQKWVLSAVLIAALGSQYYFSTASTTVVSSIEMSSLAQADVASVKSLLAEKKQELTSQKAELVKAKDALAVANKALADSSDEDDSVTAPLQVAVDEAKAKVDELVKKIESNEKSIAALEVIVKENQVASDAIDIEKLKEDPKIAALIAYLESKGGREEAAKTTPKSPADRILEERQAAREKTAKLVEEKKAEREAEQQIIETLATDMQAEIDLCKSMDTSLDQFHSSDDQVLNCVSIAMNDSFYQDSLPGKNIQALYSAGLNGNPSIAAQVSEMLAPMIQSNPNKAAYFTNTLKNVQLRNSIQSNIGNYATAQLGSLPKGSLEANGLTLAVQSYRQQLSGVPSSSLDTFKPQVGVILNGSDPSQTRNVIPGTDANNNFNTLNTGGTGSNSAIIGGEYSQQRNTNRGAVMVPQ